MSARRRPPKPSGASRTRARRSRKLGIARPPTEVLERLRARAAVDPERPYLRVLEITDLELIAAEIMPPV